MLFRSPPRQNGGPALLTPAEVHALRRRAGRGAGRAVVKVVIAGGGPLARRAALARFATLPGFTAEAEGAPVEFGTLGRITMGEGLHADLVALPSDPALAPLWRPFAAGAVGALLLLPADGVAAPLAELSRALRLPAGACAPSEEALAAALGRPAAEVAFLGGDPAEALRALLADASRRG